MKGYRRGVAPVPALLNEWTDGYNWPFFRLVHRRDVAPVPAQNRGIFCC